MNFYCGFKFFIIYLIFIISLSVVLPISSEAVSYGCYHRKDFPIPEYALWCKTQEPQLNKTCCKSDFCNKVRYVESTTGTQDYHKFPFKYSHKKRELFPVLIVLSNVSCEVLLNNNFNLFFFLKNLVFVDDQLIIIYEKSLISLSLSFHELKMINSNVISHLSLLLIEFFYFFFWCV